ncbi:hypothetical protein BDF19DRAFT_436986 [Syncephalis fuscata]|nr:hypothetical protein BDF19DRAFT_436986 [Syncephalis fuscata]
MSNSSKHRLALPIELLEAILLYLDQESLISLATCARWLGDAVCQSERLWRYHYQEQFGDEEPIWLISSTLPAISSTTTTTNNDENDTDQLSMPAKRSSARWLTFLRLRAAAPLNWKHGTVASLPVILPQLDTLNTDRQVSEPLFPGELKLLDANIQGWSLVACTEPLTILLACHPPSTDPEITNISQWASPTRLCPLSLDPRLIKRNGNNQHLSIDDSDIELWSNARYAPFHEIHGRLSGNDYAVVTIIAASTTGTTSQWRSAIWIWRLVDRTLCWYSGSQYPFIISAICNHSLLYRQRYQQRTNAISKSQYQPHNYETATDILYNSSEHHWTFTFCQLAMDKQNAQKTNTITSVDELKQSIVVAEGAAGCCHLHKIRSSRSYPLSDASIIDVLVYRHNYDRETQQFNWQLIRPSIDGADDTGELQSNLQRWGLSSEGSLGSRPDEIHRTVSTQVDNTRVVLAGMTRDEHQRLTPFILLHSLSHTTTSKNGQLWHCTGPRYTVQSVIPAPNRRHLLLLSSESMIRIISLETGQVLRGIPGLPHEGIPQSIVGDLWLMGATFHGELVLVDTEKSEQYLHQLEEIPSPLISSISADDQLTRTDFLLLDEWDLAHKRQHRIRPGLERQRWSVGLVGHDLLICVRPRAITMVRVKKAAPRIHLATPNRLPMRNKEGKLVHRLRRATITSSQPSNKYNGSDGSETATAATAATDHRPLQRRTTLLRTMARAIGNFRQTVSTNLTTLDESSK